MTKWQERARFITIYISEAHPTGNWDSQIIIPDEWHMYTEICYEQPKELKDRITLAKKFAQEFDYPLPIYTDDPKTDIANNLFGAWPERLYVVEDGKVVYKGALGPDGYKVSEVQDCSEQGNRFEKEKKNQNRFNSLEFMFLCNERIFMRNFL